MNQREHEILKQKAEELGLPVNEMVHAYQTALRDATAFETPQDFNTLLNNAVGILSMHLDVMQQVDMIATDFNLDVKVVYEIYMKFLELEGNTLSNNGLVDKKILIENTNKLTHSFIISKNGNIPEEYLK